MEIVTAGRLDWFLLKRAATKFAHEQKLLLADPRIDPDQIEADIEWKVAVNDVRYNLSYEQREEIRDLIWLESGLKSLRDRQIQQGLNRVG